MAGQGIFAGLENAGRSAATAVVRVLFQVNLKGATLASVSLFFLYNVTSAIYLTYFHPLAKFPGPRLAAISRLPFARSAVRGETYKWLDELHERYGPVVRVAPNELTTIAVGAWSDIYLRRPQLRKDPHSQTPPLNGVHSLFTAHGPSHARMRRTYANGFSERALKDQAQNIEPYVEGLVQRLRREIEKAEKSKESLDIGKFYGYAALDIISDMTFGDSFHGLESDNGHDWIRGFFLGAKFGAVRNSLSYFYPLDRLFGMVFLRLTAKVRARNWKYAADRVKKRLEMAEAGIDRSDFVTPVIGHVTTEEEKGITLTELSNNSLAMVIAGCQLPTIALTTATYLLCKNLETYQRLQEEIRSSFAKAEDINLQSVQSLSYLSAVVDETLRLHHPTPIHLPRIVPPEGQLIDGQWIPGNVSTGNMLESAGLNVSQTIIGIALQTAQTSSLHWEDARGFHPERFLEPEHPWFDSRFSRDNKDIFHPYSIGNRNCIAARFFQGEAKLILARIIFSFDIQLTNETDSNWMDQKAFLVFDMKPVYVKLRESTAPLV